MSSTQERAPVKNTQLKSIQFNGILLNNKNKWSTNTWMNLKDIKRKKSQKNTRIVWSHLYDMCRVGKPVETEGRLLVV